MYLKEQDLLIQYGVLGMRWGKRTGSASRTSSKRKVGKTRLSKRELLAAEAAKRQREIAKIKKMNSKDLSELVERKRLEKALIDQLPSAPEKKKYFDIKQIGAEAVSSTAEKMVGQLTSAAAAKAINKLLGSEVVFANNKKK